MSISIQYDHSDPPSFPYVTVAASNSDREYYVPQQGKIDTGSPITVIPEYLLKLLDLKKMTTVEVGGFGSEITPRDAYFLNIKIGNIVFPYVKVISQSDDRRPNILIGRNIINLWKMNLDGENHTGSFNEWSTNPSNAT